MPKSHFSSTPVSVANALVVAESSSRAVWAEQLLLDMALR